MKNNTKTQDKPLFFQRRFSKLTSHITVREFQSDGWTVKEIEVDEIQEEESYSWVESQAWDRDDPEFWEEIFSQRPSWERD